jgi:hypothetical protein
VGKGKRKSNTKRGEEKIEEQVQKEINSRNENTGEQKRKSCER